jgi:hypothetical protein
MSKQPTKWAGFAISVVLFIVLTTTVAYAQAPYQFPFGLSGSGSMLNSPAVYQGTIISGPMAGGSFVIEIDDSMWPVDDPGTPEDERWDYILANHFTYSTTGDPHWTGHFPLYEEIIPPVEWRFTNGADQMGGIIYYLVITILDSDRDAQVDQDELANQAVAADFVCHKEQGGGGYEEQCGFGSSNGNLENYDPQYDDLLTLSGTLSMRGFGCAVPVREGTWGVFKILYE